MLIKNDERPICFGGDKSDFRGKEKNVPLVKLKCPTPFNQGA